ncbi:2OG-Fe(II) oxygenase [Candidatus Uabimicrobium amorphum]|uniref:Prolyl 4-hydroxylase alpha subunit domain-containing protein n=1 Tax=Uabimicrobium amorphum TaxID=2596890 RepID=A0A5S9IU19_UABAM|nr:2OG-Fe(II) oxygenase [Candidatus Uabimicrobium amorphum]BBM87382.1 hypothetical protein UABAM_05791 [Candidatus Uabimicrobium amorphum]
MNLDHSQKYIFTLSDVFSVEECKKYIDKINDNNPKLAPLNTLQGSRFKPQVRNNERIIFDDVPLAKDLFGRIQDKVPREIHGAKLCGVNERFRGYRYKKDMHFAPHADGAFFRNDHERSYYTFLIYLNENFKGGNTTFIVEPEVSIPPQTGMALFFQHPLIHEGQVVVSGIKYVLRSDVMYCTV